MVRQRLATVRDVVVESNSPALTTGRVVDDGLVAELLPLRRPYSQTHGSDSQSFVSQVVKLAKILTGASGSAIAFREEQGTICWARSGEGAPPLGAPVDITSGISKQCLDSGISLCCEDIATDGRVDPEVSKVAGIRAVAVVPIYADGEISGILEVFSSVPGTFTDLHLKRLQQLANWVSSVASMPSEEPTRSSNADVDLDFRPGITLLIAQEPGYRVFFQNLADVVSLRSPALLGDSSRQMHGWNNVFVDTHVPWKRFIESVFLHIMVVGMLSGLSRIWPRELLISPRPLREAGVTYYPFSQSFPAHESSRQAEYPRQQHTSAHQEGIRSGRHSESRVASGTPGAVDGEKIHALTSPPPAMPVSAISRFRKPGLGAAVLPPPDIDQAQARQPHLSNSSVIAPPPELSGGSGLRTMNAPRATVVPPSPDIRGLETRAVLIDRIQLRGGSAGTAGISIVPPAPSLNDRSVLTSRATGVVPATSVQVVAPPPSIQAGARLDAIARAIALGGGVSQIVAPPPSLAGASNSVGGGRRNSLVAGGSQAVPPPPSIQALGEGNSGAGGRVGSLAGAGAEGVLPPAPAKGEGNSRIGGARVADNASTSSVLEADDERLRPIYQDVQLRVISLVWAPPRSSYFSNFEVFIAEKWLNKEETQFIKLVYVFLPYQRPLSEYSLDALKIRRLRVTRDSTCDEGLMEMMWPEGENGPTASQPSGEPLASSSTDRKDALPCYRTTADDYRRAVSRRR